MPKKNGCKTLNIGVDLIANVVKLKGGRERIGINQCSCEENKKSNFQFLIFKTAILRALALL